MSNAVTYSGKWRIKPSARLPIFFRFMNNACFVSKYMKTAGIENSLPDRVYVNHMIYFPAITYNRFEKEIINHLEKNDGWFEKYYKVEMRACRKIYNKGNQFKKIDWTKKTNQKISVIISDFLEEERKVGGPWYAQYPLDEYFEKTIEQKLCQYIKKSDDDFRKIVLIFSDSEKMTEVAEERWKLMKIAKKFFSSKENLEKLSPVSKKIIEKHLDKFAYINRGLATSKPYSFVDIIERIKEIKKQVVEGKSIDSMIHESSEGKIKKDFRWALDKIKPRQDFLRIIKQCRRHSYFRNVRVESFFNADYGISFAYAEVARRAKFNPDWVMEISIQEMMDSLLKNKPLPSRLEMERRLKDYAMIVKNGKTTLITNKSEIKKLAKKYSVDVKRTEEIQGVVACIGGIIRGKAKICLDKNEIGKVKRGDILVAQFTTPDFVPAMEKAVAIVADQGGLSSHAAIVSRELGVPCIMATKNGTRIIHDNDLIEVNAKIGTVKVLKRAK